MQERKRRAQILINQAKGLGKTISISDFQASNGNSQSLLKLSVKSYTSQKNSNEVRQHYKIKYLLVQSDFKNHHGRISQINPSFLKMEAHRREEAGGAWGYFRSQCGRCTVTGGSAGTLCREDVRIPTGMCLVRAGRVRRRRSDSGGGRRP
ncbi:hypothetical protein HAX54_001385 [Datura stramonium]|uniref:Uncharacterized protein n=1 Tax=Datura stramonium TaxID=4076 RepID=A0ABS8WST3_DATST|nr:hypothetical protein [Datura stramonium]